MTGAADSTTVALVGDLDLAASPDLHRQLVEETTARAVVVDMDKVPFLDSAGLRELLICVRDLQSEGRTLSLVGVQPGPWRLLEVTHLVEPLMATPARRVRPAPSWEMLGQISDDRALIEQAKGILMNAEDVDADSAFELLIRASQRQNRKLRDLAAEIVNRRGRGGLDGP